jgi:hypothetical protein
MRTGRIHITLFLAMTAVIFVTLSCSKSTSSGQTEYDWAIRIGCLINDEAHFVFQGAYSDVPVYIDSMPDADIDSFSIVIAYDPKALTFILAEPGEMISDWDEFTFSERVYDLEDGDSSLQLVKITAQRSSSENYKSGKKNEKAANTIEPLPLELFSMKFYVTDDRHYECHFIPLYFFWAECEDNTIYYHSGKNAAYSENVHGISWINGPNSWYTMLPEDGSIDSDDHFYGAYDDCWDGTARAVPKPDASIDFYNGGVDISCSYPIDGNIGDINHNNLAYELADFYLFADYFIYGDSIFIIDKLEQIRATEINDDGFYLTLADFCYMARILCGDAVPQDDLSHNVDTVEVSIIADTLSISSEIDLGAAFFIFNGDIEFKVLDTGFQVKSDFVSGKTRILFYSLQGARFEHGITSILKSTALDKLDSCQFSGYYGEMVVTKMPE